MTEHQVHALEQPVRDDVLEYLGLPMHFAPVRSRDTDQEHLDRALTAKNVSGQLAWVCLVQSTRFDAYVLVSPPTKITMDLGPSDDRSYLQQIPSPHHVSRGSTLLIESAEYSYRKGLAALSAGRRKEAMAQFEAAIEIERRQSPARPQPRYLSYYGLCLALARSDVREGLRYCREAVTMEGYNPDLRCNLGRVLLRAGRRREAYRCFAGGLRLHAGHPPTLRALTSMGVRRRPVIPFLGRANPINVILGRLRYR